MFEKKETEARIEAADAKSLQTLRGQRHDPKRPSGSWRGRWEERHEQAEDPGRQLLARPDCRMRLKSWGRRRTPRSPSIMNHGNGLGAAAWPSAVESWEAGTR